MPGASAMAAPAGDGESALSEWRAINLRTNAAVCQLVEASTDVAAIAHAHRIRS